MACLVRFHLGCLWFIPCVYGLGMVGAWAQTPADKPQPSFYSDRREYSFLPATDYSTDKGVGIGAVGMIAQFREGYYPYQWRIFFIARATLAISQEGQFHVPFHEYKFTFDLPGPLHGNLRWKGEFGFFRFITTGYYGLGNGSLALPDQPGTFYQYDRIYPKGLLEGQWFLWRKGPRSLSLFYGIQFHYNVIQLFSGSQLAQDLWRSLNEKDPVSIYAREYLRGLSPHALFKAKIGLVWDGRDHEYDPEKGTFYEISLRGSPGIGSQLYFVGIHSAFHAYIPIYRKYLQLAFRVLGDVLVGQVPLYELAIYGAFREDDGPGGDGSVRGLPNQRLHGKAKLIANVELRSMFLPFRLFGQQFVLGLTAFVDAGRVWLDYSYPSEEIRQAYDGTDPIGLQWGFGGGIRLRWGETFVIRFDLGWSPTGLPPFRFYFTLGHLF